MMPSVIATLFDYNGVLVDDEDMHFAAFREAIAPLGLTLDEETYKARYLGFDDVGAFRAMLADAGKPATHDDIARLVDAKKPLYLARAKDLKTFPGAKEIVVRRAARGPVGIVSGALRNEIDLGLRVLGIEALVTVIVSAEDAPQCKPDPQGYLLAKERLQVEMAVVIEDSIAGVEAAVRAGLRCVGVAHTYSEHELMKAGAAIVAPTLAAIDDAMLG